MIVTKHSASPAISPSFPQRAVAAGTFYYSARFFIPNNTVRIENEKKIALKFYMDLPRSTMDSTLCQSVFSVRVGTRVKGITKVA